MYHLSHAKLDRKEYRRILSLKFGLPATTSELDKEVVEILNTRQKSIRKRVSVVVRRTGSVDLCLFVFSFLFLLYWIAFFLLFLSFDSLSAWILFPFALAAGFYLTTTTKPTIPVSLFLNFVTSVSLFLGPCPELHVADCECRNSVNMVSRL